MSDAGLHAAIAWDENVRQRIATDLDTNMLVEAGAGSGKTTSLIGRMLALIERGTPVERIAAVTFTRKAANELRERFQISLENRADAVEPGTELRLRLDAALADLERAFVGTIHSFCGRLLRERPLEAGLDPHFIGLTDEDAEELCRTFWRRWIERKRATDDPALRDLATVGIDVRTLYAAFKRIVDYPDVEFPVEDRAAPDITECRRKLESLLRDADEILPRSEPPDGWDKLMSLVRRLRFESKIRPWNEVAAFCASVASITDSDCRAIQKRWGADKTSKDRAKHLQESFAELLTHDIAEVLRCWWEHRYPKVMTVLQRAANDFDAERHATAQLNFADLLLLAAKLLRESNAARDEMGNRYRHVFVDEFQDTDPVQAEVCFLIASESQEGVNWRTVTPRAGSLFVVGDPKQSIYRFRRADIQIYELVRKRFEMIGAVLPLTRNFRSTKPIEKFVNGYFEHAFRDRASDVQAAFSPMLTEKTAGAKDGVYRYVIGYAGRESASKAYALDSAVVASWIAERIASGDRSPADFLVLTSRKAAIGYYARALAGRNVPVATTGARLPQELELEELLVVLRAIADPENSVFVAAALEGLFFGASPADLYDAHEAHVRFAITHSPKDIDLPVTRALNQLHTWWALSQQEAADVLLGRIINDTGLLPYAASQELGEARAGALLHLVESLRSVSLVGRGGITDAMEYLELLLTLDAPDTPLRPGRTDAVRVMNLHKAKGLEAPIVILAAPADERPHDPELHVFRIDEATPIGGMVLLDMDGRIVAQPPNWIKLSAREEQFQSAESERLLYVAATRAMNELVVAQCERTLSASIVPDASRWRPLAPALDEHGTKLHLEERPAPGRALVERSLDDIRVAERATYERTGICAAETVRFTTVTESAKEERADARRYDLPSVHPLGVSWGRAVHRALEGAALGREGEALSEYVRAVSIEEGLDAAQVAQLERLTTEVARSGAWRQLRSMGSIAPELPVMLVEHGPSCTTVTEGVIDAAVVDANGWRIVDWKSDDVGEEEWSERRAQYAKQVGRYAEILRILTGLPASGTIERARVAE